MVVLPRLSFFWSRRLSSPVKLWTRYTTADVVLEIGSTSATMVWIVNIQHLREPKSHRLQACQCLDRRREIRRRSDQTLRSWSSAGTHRLPTSARRAHQRSTERSLHRIRQFTPDATHDALIITSYQCRKTSFLWEMFFSQNRKFRAKNPPFLDNYSKGKNQNFEHTLSPLLEIRSCLSQNCNFLARNFLNPRPCCVQLCGRPKAVMCFLFVRPSVRPSVRRSVTSMCSVWVSNSVTTTCRKRQNQCNQ